MATVTAPRQQTAAERAAELNILVRKQRSLWQDAWYRLVRNRAAVLGMVIVAHVMKNALIPVVTIVGPATAGLITGSIIIEGLFSIPGIGRLFLTSIIQRDYPLIMGTYMLYAVLIAVANLVVDLTYGIVDPRIRFDR